MLIPICILYLILAGAASGCPLASSDWNPLSLSTRTERSEIVLSATTLSITRFSTRMGWTASFRLLQFYKGEGLVTALAAWTPGSFNVSNFGSTELCFSSVKKDRRYILFLAVFEQQLSARYDDLMGAVASFTSNHEEQVLTSLGYGEWSTWSKCSGACGSSQQMRTRQCRAKGCSAHSITKPCTNSECNRTKKKMNISTCSNGDCAKRKKFTASSNKKKFCKAQILRNPVARTYWRILPTQHFYACGLFGWNTCSKIKLEKHKITKIFYRTSKTCI